MRINAKNMYRVTVEYPEEIKDEGNFVKETNIKGVFRQTLDDLDVAKLARYLNQEISEELEIIGHLGKIK